MDRKSFNYRKFAALGEILVLTLVPGLASSAARLTTSSPLPAAVAHPLIARPSVQAPLCSPNLQIESVTYLGKNNGKDSVQVIFNGLPPTVLSGGFGNATATSCARYGVPQINTNFGGSFGGGFPGGTSVQQGFGGATLIQNFGYELTVTITRRLGHQDTGTAKSSNIFSGQITSVVQIPRGAAETDPVKYDVTINTTFGGRAEP